MKHLLFACTLALTATIAMFAACKQGQGERCQTSEDCSGGLVCNEATGTCETTTGAGFDAEVPDGTPSDAAVDAVPDAVGDAMPDA